MYHIDIFILFPVLKSRSATLSVQIALLPNGVSGRNVKHHAMVTVCNLDHGKSFKDQIQDDRDVVLRSSIVSASIIHLVHHQQTSTNQILFQNNR
ncbi:elongation of very long chain fatty acids protein 6-like [Sarcoptes scabiei]|nr:elongation of very long chain fatty acids protein 6-like [Sarcoptes scabiei]